MRFPSIHIPYAEKIISVVLFLVLIVWIVFNSIQSQKQSKDTSLLIRTFDRPFSIQSHVQTALTLWDRGFYKTAKKELVLASDLYMSDPGSVLGVATAPAKILADWESQPQKLYGDYAFWVEVTREKPDYRDGFFMAGVNAYKLGKRSEAKEYFQKAYALDPNYPPLNTLLVQTRKVILRVPARYLCGIFHYDVFHSHRTGAC